MTNVFPIDGSVRDSALSSMDDDEPTYKIVRFYRDSSELNRTVIKTGLTLDEAREHCHDKETSSSTCEGEDGVKHTELYGAWFDGFEEE